MQALKKLLLFLAWSVNIFFVAAFLVPNRGNPNVHSVLALSLVVLVWIYLITAIHEAGHFLAARLARFRVFRLAIGPLSIDFQKPLPRVTFKLLSNNPYQNLGHVLAIPNDDRNLKSRFLLLYAGGPLAHTFALLCALAATVLANDTVSLTVAYLARGALIASAGLFLLELIPVKSSDCSKILKLMFSRTISRPIAIATLTGQSMSGVRPRDWSKALVSLLSSVADKTEESALSHLLEYYHALDSQAFQAACEHLADGQACEIKKNNVLVSTFSNEAAYVSALRGDVSSAHSLLSNADSSLHQHSLLRTKAAIAFAEGNIPQAQDYAQQSLQTQSECIDKGWLIAERELLIEILRHGERASQSGWVSDQRS